MVFSDPAALADLNAITHPAIGAEMARRKESAEGRTRWSSWTSRCSRRSTARRCPSTAVVVVDAPVETALARLIELRGMTREDAEARMAAQVSREERLSGADLVIDNSLDLDHLGSEVDRVWAALMDRQRELRDASVGGSGSG